MYNCKYDLCGCDRDRLAGIEDIQKGICYLKEGIKDIYKGLDCLCSCCIQDGVKAINRGLCKLEKGICYILDGLKDLEYDNDCRDRKEMKEAICDIKEGIRCVQKGLCDVCKRRVCEGIKAIHEGLQHIEKGLCELTDDLDDILSENDMKRKRTYDVMDEMTYRNRHCGCGGAGNDPTDFKF
ncbi:MAG: hypothetical protein PHC91_02460 [Eubacteriales bacterium]|nr:hypothetical protein [Eubacteriales bacterium]